MANWQDMWYVDCEGCANHVLIAVAKGTKNVREMLNKWMEYKNGFATQEKNSILQNVRE